MPKRRLTSFAPAPSVVLLFALATVARAEPPHLKDPHKAQEAAVVKRCVEVECPKFCALDKDKATECRKHCTPAEHCKLAFPARDNTPLQKLMQAELFAELHEVQPPHAIDPPHHAPLPSDEPPFHLQKVAPAAHPAHAEHPDHAVHPAAASVSAAQDPHKAGPHPSVKHTEEPEPHWTERTTPSWEKLVHPAPPAK